MFERKPYFSESRIIRAIVMLYIDDDSDAEAIAEEADVTVEEVRDFMREAS